MIKVFIADDHAIVRKGLVQILNDTADMKLVGEGENGTDVLDSIGKLDYDVLVLDITMPGRNGLDILKQLKEIKPKLPVLILSMHPEDQYAKRVLKAGASGYLTKESASEELINAIRIINNGRKYITANIAESMADDLEKNRIGPLHEKLSDREFEVLQFIARGKTVSEIGNILSLSVKTISTNRSRILKKMNLKNNAELICYAVKHDLVEIDIG